MMFLLAVLVIGGFAVYVMKPDERVKLLQRGVAAAREAADAAVQYHRERDAFREALHTRTPWPIVLPVLVALNAGVFIGMIFGAGAIADPADARRVGRQRRSPHDERRMVASRDRVVRAHGVLAPRHQHGRPRGGWA